MSAHPHSLRWERSPLALLGFVLIIGVGRSTPTAAAGPAPIGAEFQVNSFTNGDQWYPAVAAAPSGDFLVVWSDKGLPPGQAGGWATGARRFAESGSPLGQQLRVNEATATVNADLAVAASATGDFLVVWYDNQFHPAWGRGVRARLLGRDGEFVGAERPLGDPASSGRSPSVAALEDEGFVVVWAGPHGRRLDSTGTPVGEEFEVHSSGSGGIRPAVAALDGGVVVVAWEGDTGVEARAFAAEAAGSTVPLGPQKTLASDPAYTIRRPALTALGGNEFVVAWRKEYPGAGIFGRRTTWAQGGGTPKFTVLEDISAGSVELASDSDGNFVVAWKKGYFYPPFPGYGEVYGRRYDAAGDAIDEVSVLNSITTGVQLAPAVASLPGGNFVVTWWSTESSGTDTSGTSVQARLFGTIDPDRLFTDGFESGDTSRWSEQMVEE